MNAEVPEGAGGPGLFRSPVARAVLALGFGVVAFVLVAALSQRPPKRSELVEDTATLRGLAGALIRARSPLAPDGRLDVYGALESRDARACRSSRAGAGPTLREIEARDYTNFPWQRRRGAFDPEGAPVPILWERSPMEAHAGGLCRIVAYSDGSVRVLVGDEDEAMLEFFRRNPGQE